MVFVPNKDRVKRREYARRWKQAVRDKWLAENGPCRRCGGTEALEVDHIDPRQKLEHRIWTWSAKRRAAELAKCQVLCWVCHRQKSVTDRRASRSRCTRPLMERVRCIADTDVDARFVDPGSLGTSPSSESVKKKRRAAPGAEWAANLLRVESSSTRVSAPADGSAHRLLSGDAEARHFPGVPHAAFDFW